MREKFPRLCRVLVAPNFAVEFVNIIFTVLDCNTLQLAIIQGNISQVEDLIKTSPSTVLFQNVMGQSPLHLASDWPWATVLLLMNGADPSQVDSYHYNAIDYACVQGNYEIVRILLEAGSPLPVHGPLDQIIRCSPTRYSERFFKLIISHLANRRRELLQIARTLLPEAMLNGIVPPNEAVPDSSAYELIAAVCAAGYTTKSEYWYYHKNGLYQSYHMFPAAADILYEAGFTYLDGQNMWDETPLTSTHTSTMTVWLYEKGASFTRWTSSRYKQCFTPSMPSMYVAVKELAGSIRVHKKAGWKGVAKACIRQLKEDDFKAFQILLQDDFSDCRDLCRCPCSSGGCSPEVIILKTILLQIGAESRFSKSPVQLLPEFIELVDQMMARLHGKLAPSNFRRLSQAGIRMALFLDLGIRHLCCKWNGVNITSLICQKEADEIREEDRLATEQFEGLLPKAQSAWEKSSRGIAEFWREFHRANICIRRNRHVDENDLEKLRELGVILHERGDEEAYCGSLCGDEDGYCESLSDDEGGHCDSR